VSEPTPEKDTPDSGASPPDTTLRNWIIALVLGALIVIGIIAGANTGPDTSTVRGRCEQAWEDSKDLDSMQAGITKSEYVDNCVEAQEFIEELRSRDDR
jgi:hypothetical protein